MVKCAVVKSSVLAKHGRWDPGYYLGLTTKEETEADVVKAELGLQQATTRLTNARRSAAAAQARREQFIRDGDVVPFPQGE